MQLREYRQQNTMISMLSGFNVFLIYTTPRSDVCHYCEDFRVKLSFAVTEADKVCLTKRRVQGTH